eukprot:3387099-Amphidinium_carterae.1
MFTGATSFNHSISSWCVCSVRDMSDMFCAADSFSFLELLKTSWQMQPAVCATSTRELTPSE